MQLKAKTPLLSIKPTYRKDSIQKADFENFIDAFRLLMEQTEKASLSSESEEHHKGLLSDFLKDTFYKKSGNYVNTKKLKGNSEIDLAVFLGKNAESKVGVLIEVKEHSNKSEMLNLDNKNNISGKAFYEAVQYYLYEKIINDNHEIKNIIITNTLEWFVFDATEFNNLFYQNSKLKKHFINWQKGLTDNSSTKQMYEVIGKMVKDSKKEIIGTHIKLNDYKKYLDKNTPEAKKKLSTLFKFFSPRHLLKEETTNDSNSLNKNFYNELLHIIGLEETKVKGKKLIQRKAKREIASLLENTIVKIESRGVLRRLQNIFDYGSTKDEQLFNIGLELCITWVNRILFLKLLESQLISYHNGNKEYAFLHPDRITEFDELETLFFEILAIPTKDRKEHTKTEFPNIPYLNSSLFEPTDLEDRTGIYISSLKDKQQLSKHSKTVLKKEPKKTLSTLEYLFRFLDAYDFGIEGKEEIQEESKSLINASVLGLIFEKINGYKDGSFYTPSFITMYMCRESIRRAVTEKLNNSLEWNCKTFDDIHNYLEPSNYKIVNEVINSITICDPAVGSGHFLVSALNEMISIKAELGILLDKDGKRLRNYSIVIDNDELVVTDEDGEFLHYGFTEKGNIKKEEHRLQETLFLEKKAIIENCLFGVDINPNSVKICRLRLWIELLKNAFYTQESQYKELETLPNIDINIKQGNSLISRYALDLDLKEVFKKKKYNIDKYKKAVSDYRQTRNKDTKNKLFEYLKDIKEQFKTSVFSKEIAKISRLRGKIQLLENPNDLFGSQKIDKALIKKEKTKLKKLETIRDETLGNKIYQNAFEWRFEFPEVLDNEGNYIGFDCVIGNPPYVQIQKMGNDVKSLKPFYKVYEQTGDLYSLFYEKSLQLLANDAYLCFITGSAWMRAKYGKKLRQFFKDETNPIQLIDFSDCEIFDSATVLTNIMIYQKTENKNQLRAIRLIRGMENEIEYLKEYFINNHIVLDELPLGSWVIVDKERFDIKKKIEKDGKKLIDWNININYGLKTGYNEAFIIDKAKRDELIKLDSKNSEIIKPILRGRDIQKNHCDFQKIWIINTHNGIKDLEIEPIDVINDYPVIHKHLLKYKARAEKRSDKGKHWTNLRNCAYLPRFEEKKIIYPNMTKFLPFVLDDSKFYTNQKCYIITGEKLEYLVSFFNSKLFRYSFEDNFPELQGNTREMNKVIFEELPIKYISKEEEKPFIKLATEILEVKKENPKADTKNLETEIDNLVYKLYDLTPEEIQIIEDATK